MGNKLDFLYDLKLSNGKPLPGGCVACLLSIDEFVDEVKKYKFEEISPFVIYQEAEKIYFPIRKDFENEEFSKQYKKENGNSEYAKLTHKYSKINRTLKTLSKALYHENKYLEDYEEWKRTADNGGI